MIKSYTILKTPVKIGDESTVPAYASTLTHGEEQLLVTRNGKLFITDGAGSFVSFRINSSYDSSQIDDLLIDIQSDIADVDTKATHANRAELDKLGEDIFGNPVYGNKQILVDFDTNDLIRLNDLNIFKDEVTSSISIIDGELDDLSNATTLSLQEIRNEITALQEANIEEASIDDITEHPTLPSFSIMPTLGTTI